MAHCATLSFCVVFCNKSRTDIRLNRRDKASSSAALIQNTVGTSLLPRSFLIGHVAPLPGGTAVLSVCSSVFRKSQWSVCALLGELELPARWRTQR